MLLNRSIWIQAKAGQVKLAVGDVLGGQPTWSQPTRIKLVFREALWKHSLKRNKLSILFRCNLKTSFGSTIRQDQQHLLQIWGVSKHGQGWKRSNARHWRGRPARSNRVKEWKTHFFFRNYNSNRASLEMRAIMFYTCARIFLHILKRPCGKPPPLNTNFHFITIW